MGVSVNSSASNSRQSALDVASRWLVPVGGLLGERCGSVAHHAADDEREHVPPTDATTTAPTTMKMAVRMAA
jgi:hypothetical protein